MDLETVILSQESQTEKETYHMISIKMIQMNLFTKQQQTLRLRELVLFDLGVRDLDFWLVSGLI